MISEIGGTFFFFSVILRDRENVLVPTSLRLRLNVVVVSQKFELLFVLYASLKSYKLAVAFEVADKLQIDGF